MCKKAKRNMPCQMACLFEGRYSSEQYKCRVSEKPIKNGDKRKTV